MTKFALVLLAVALAAGCDNKTSAFDPTDPIQVSKAMQPTVDRWSGVDPASLPTVAPSLVKGRKTMVIFFDPPVAYAPSSAGSCLATKPEDVGIVVLARSKEEPVHLSATGAALHDKTWDLQAIAVPEGKRIASWSRRALAGDTTRASRATRSTPIALRCNRAPRPRLTSHVTASTRRATSRPPSRRTARPLSRGR